MKRAQILVIFLSLIITLPAYADINSDLRDAARKGNSAAVEIFLVRGADLNVKGHNNHTALMWAARRGYSDIVKILLEQGADVKAKNNDGKTALMYAKEQGHAEIIAMLSRAQGAKDNNTNLVYAARKGDVGAVLDFLDQGADINAKDEDGETALIMATKLGHSSVVRILLKKGAAMSVEDSYGWTARMYAEEKGYNKIVSLFEENLLRAQVKK